MIKNWISIIDGHARHVMGIKTSITVHREEEYCKKCPMSHKDGRYTSVCIKQKGGCGCGVGPKTCAKYSACPLGFWANDYFKPELFKEYLKENPLDNE